MGGQTPRVKAVDDFEQLGASHHRVTLAPSPGCLVSNSSSTLAKNLLQKIPEGRSKSMARAASSATGTVIIAARLGEMRPYASLRSGMPTVIGHHQVSGKRGITQFVKSRLALATCHPPPFPFLSSL